MWLNVSGIPLILKQTRPQFLVVRNLAGCAQNGRGREIQRTCKLCNKPLDCVYSSCFQKRDENAGSQNESISQGGPIGGEVRALANVHISLQLLASSVGEYYKLLPCEASLKKRRRKMGMKATRF